MTAQPNIQSLFGGASPSLDRLPMLRTVFERAAVVCAQDLRSLGGAPPPQLALAELSAGAAGDVFAQHDGAIVTAALEAPGWSTRGVISARRGAVFALVEAMLGGDGSQPAYAGKRPFSKIETRIAGAFFERLAKALSAAVAPVAATTFALAAPANTIDFDVVGGKGTPVIAATYNLEALGRGGEIVVAVPQAAIVSMRKAFERTPAKDLTRPDPRWTQQIEREITRASVSLSAVLDERQMTLGDIARLRVGQVLHLRATPRTRVHLECDGERMILCQFGRSGGVYTLRVEDFVDREREFMNDILSG
jgi:flagellar motor switch protein FliM